MPWDTYHTLCKELEAYVPDFADADPVKHRQRANQCLENGDNRVARKEFKFDR
jgi:hypothetical protein